MANSRHASQHPLSDVVISAFTPENGHHDRLTIATYLAGAALANTKLMNAYISVAEDVLDQLVKAERLKLDAVGWLVIA